VGTSFKVRPFNHKSNTQFAFFGGCDGPDAFPTRETSDEIMEDLGTFKDSPCRMTYEESPFKSQAQQGIDGFMGSNRLVGKEFLQNWPLDMPVLGGQAVGKDERFVRAWPCRARP